MAPSRPHVSLEGGESLIEILERVRRARGPAIVLDVSRHRVLRERADVRRLLQAAAADEGKTLTIDVSPAKAQPVALSAMPRPRRLVRQRIQSFRRGRHAVVAVLRPARGQRATAGPWMKVPLVLAALAGALLTSVVVFVLPRARIVIEPVTEPLMTDLTFILDTSAREPRPADRILPAKHVLVEEESEGEFPVETIVERGERASGVAELVNDTSAGLGIKSGTRLQALDGVLVRTQRDVVLPPHGRAPVPVRADTGGSAGNLEPQRLTLPALSSAAQRVIHAETVRPLRGGTDHAVRTVAQADLDHASSELTRRAEERLKSALSAEQARQQRGSMEWFTKPELTRVAVASTTSSVPVGAEADAVRVRAPVRAEALVVDADALRGFVRDLLRDSASERARRSPGGAGLEMDVTGHVDLADVRVLTVQWVERRAELSLHVETTAIPRFDPGLVRRQLAGRTAESAEAFLRALPGVRAASVTLSPVWVRRVPDNPRNVHLTVAVRPE